MPPRTQTRPPPRIGPRPLGLHLAIAATTWLNSAAVLPFLRSGSPGSKDGPDPHARPLSLAAIGWRPAVRAQAEELAKALASVDPDAFAAAVGREVRRRLDELETGIRKYRRHPYRRALTDPPSVWQAGATRLLDYGGAPGAVPVLVVPSLINRAYVLDLSAERSLMRFLAATGVRPFLVDWGAPGAAERGLDLTGCVDVRLHGALDRVRELSGRKPVVLGYCMGGLLALALALARVDDIAALALLATPWDFHAERPDLGRAIAAALEPMFPVFDAMDEVPVDLLQALFASLDPFLAARKFRAFAALDPANPRAAEFVALEDWLNDGVPLPPAVARDCILGWYGANAPARGAWLVGGRPVLPERLSLPAFVVVPEQDRIVPPRSAAALARKIAGAEVLAPPLGHIGMVVGGRARALLWEPLAAWLARR